MRSKEEIQKELASVDLEIAKLCFKSQRENDYDSLREKAKALREELRFLTFRKIATDYEIDVFEEPHQRGVKYYHITLHDIPKEIGYIKVSYGANCVQKFGNIGYELDERYRGHNYTIKALEMLVDEMLSRGLEKPTIAAKPSNIPSVRIIEKFGGRIIYGSQNQFDWNIYQVDLSKKKGQTLMKK